uniref:DPE2 n=1 Tax=Arundo donax TaxID=35708 RepID=A0A0A9AP92_ARUDO
MTVEPDPSRGQLITNWTTISSASKLLLRETDCNSLLAFSAALKMTFLNALLWKRASEASCHQSRISTRSPS